MLWTILPRISHHIFYCFYWSGWSACSASAPLFTWPPIKESILWRPYKNPFLFPIAFSGRQMKERKDNTRPLKAMEIWNQDFLFRGAEPKTPNIIRENIKRSSWAFLGGAMMSPQTRRLFLSNIIIAFGDSSWYGSSKYAVPKRMEK